MVSAVAATIGAIILAARYRTDMHRIACGATFWEEARTPSDDSQPTGNVAAWISNLGSDMQLLGVSICSDNICIGMDGVTPPVPYWLRRGEQVSASHSILDLEVTAAAVARHYENRDIRLVRGVSVIFRDGYGHEHEARLDRRSRMRLREYITVRDAYDARHAQIP